MKPEEFIRGLDEVRVVAAIERAERLTTGEIRVCVVRRAVKEPIAAAREAAVRLGMDRTADRNGVLILIAPLSRSYAVVGDAGIHGRCGEAFWAEIGAELGRAFANGQANEGIEAAIVRIGEALARHFPRTPGDRNELPDSVAIE